jgi:glycosyl transferase family 87
LALLAVVFSIAHFAESGVRMPLSLPKIGQIEEEIPPLVEHLRTGDPVHSRNPRQYGPVFFLILQPLLATIGTDPESLSLWLYALDLACLTVALLLTWATLKPLVPVERRPLAAAALLFLWLNFAPLYAILGVKNVEGWELALLAAALFWYIRGRRAAAAIAVAVAGLIKLLPFIFIFYFLLRDRRAFVYSCAAVAAVLLATQLVYGSELGVRYLPRVALSATGTSFALGWHENISLKGMIAKGVGTLTPGSMTIAGADPSYGSDIGAGQAGYTVMLTRQQLAFVRLAGLAAQLVVLAWTAWICTRPSPLDANRIAWEWSIVAIVMLLVSPQTAFEYCLLAIGAFSYVLVRLIADRPRRPAPWIIFAAAALLVANVLPRQIVNRLVFVDVLREWSGYAHFTPSEAYQFFGFPFAGLLFALAALWQVRPSLHAHAAR